MLKAIQDFFNKNIEPEPEAAAEADTKHDAVAVAACALMLELAHADDEFTDDERQHIEEAVTRHFNVPQETAEELIALADEERRRAVDLYQFTSLIAKNFDEGQRMVLAEIMWRIVYSDGELAKHEHYLMHKVSKLLDLKPGYLSEAKKRAATLRID
jgi:uncharacterized tellurite resistance protein B-like protein